MELALKSGPHVTFTQEPDGTIIRNGVSLALPQAMTYLTPAQIAEAIAQLEAMPDDRGDFR